MMETPSGAEMEMPRYKSHKQVWALKIATVELHAANGHIIHPADKGYAPFRVPDEYVQKHNPQPGGYYVVYDDGYKSFSPAKAFEEGYVAIDSGAQASPLEQAIKAAGADRAPRVTPADIEANIVSEHYFTAREAAEYGPGSRNLLTQPTGLPESLSLLTFCVLVLRNGFTVIGESACASPENFNAEIGRRIARENAVAKLWTLLGFRLRDKLAAIPLDFRDRVRAEATELQGRIDKLAAFLGSDTFNNLPKDEQDRMAAQRTAMQVYSNCLAQRIAAFDRPAA